MNMCLTAGQVHDSVPAKELSEDQPAEYVIAVQTKLMIPTNLYLTGKCSGHSLPLQPQRTP